VVVIDGDGDDNDIDQSCSCCLMIFVPGDVVGAATLASESGTTVAVAVGETAAAVGAAAASVAAVGTAAAAAAAVGATSVDSTLVVGHPRAARVVKKVLSNHSLPTQTHPTAE
jgi:hypothetical protein